MTIPHKQGLYDPQFEHENCGIGLIVDMKGRKSHDIVQGALEICVNLDHRGGCGCDPITGDGAGIFIQISLCMEWAYEESLIFLLSIFLLISDKIPSPFILVIVGFAYWLVA